MSVVLFSIDLKYKYLLIRMKDRLIRVVGASGGETRIAAVEFDDSC